MKRTLTLFVMVLALAACKKDKPPVADDPGAGGVNINVGGVQIKAGEEGATIDVKGKIKVKAGEEGATVDVKGEGGKGVSVKAGEKGAKVEIKGDDGDDVKVKADKDGVKVKVKGAKGAAVNVKSDGDDDEVNVGGAIKVKTGKGGTAINVGGVKVNVPASDEDE